MRHKCKSWSPFFEAIKIGDKKHDLRHDTDRNFKIGELDVKVTYITSTD